jgi:hypothetical protein
MPVIIAKNQTASPLALTLLSAPDGVIPASGQVTLTLYNTATAIQDDPEIASHIASNSLLLNLDGVDLTKAQSQSLQTGAIVENMAANTVRANPTAASAPPQDMAVGASSFLGRLAAGVFKALTGAEATTLLSVFVGSGGAKGLVPATAAGDATKFLRGDATWAAVSAAVTADIIIPLYNGNASPYIPIASGTYVSLARFVFLGTTLLGTPTAMKITGNRNTATTYDVIILRLDTNATIAEKTGNNNAGPTDAIIDLGSIGNLPATPTIFEIKARRNNNTAQLSSFICQFR